MRPKPYRESKVTEPAMPLKCREFDACWLRSSLRLTAPFLMIGSTSATVRVAAWVMSAMSRFISVMSTVTPSATAHPLVLVHEDPLRRLRGLVVRERDPVLLADQQRLLRRRHHRGHVTNPHRPNVVGHVHLAAPLHERHTSHLLRRLERPERLNLALALVVGRAQRLTGQRVTLLGVQPLEADRVEHLPLDEPAATTHQRRHAHRSVPPRHVGARPEPCPQHAPGALRALS